MSTPLRLLGLQRAVGNRAIAGALSSNTWTPTVQRAGEAGPGKLDQAADDLYGWLVANSANVASILMTLLLQKGQQQALEKAYQDKYHRRLRDDLKAKLSWSDLVKANAYLDHGQLRVADKLYLAIHATFTDETTLMRVVPEIRAGRAAAESDFLASYGNIYSTDAVLPDGTSSRIAGAIMAETLWATFEQRFKIAAIIAFGAPRAADDVKIATVAGINNAPLLFSALQREDPKKIAADFEASYQVPIKEYLGKETSLHTKLRALMFFDENIKPEDRLIRTVEIGTSGYTTADTDFIFDAVSHATGPQIEKFKLALSSGDGRLKHIDDTFGGMNKEDRDRLNALLGLGGDAGIMGDPLVKQLRGQGGNGLGSVFETLKSCTTEHKAYRAAYDDGKSPFRQFVDQFTTPAEKGWLASYVFADFRPRLNYVLTNPGHDDYVLFLINTFASPTERRALPSDRDFGAKFGTLSTSTQNKILLSLEPDQLTPAERAIWLDQAVKRETASGAGALAGSSGALEDENRELQAAVTRAGKNPTPEQQAEIDRLTAATKDALTAFVKYRDELEAAVAGALETAAGLIAGLATGGVATVELALMAVARAALASAMAKVVANKLARGDRFDVLGADGAQAFVSGAVDGMLNAVAPMVTKGAQTGATAVAGAAGVQESAVAAARASAPKAFSQFAATTGPKMVEGAVVGGLTSAVDTGTRDQTWADGFDRGLRKVFLSGVTGAVGGGAMAAMPPALSALVAAAGSLEALESIIAGLPDPSASLEEASFDFSETKAPASVPGVQRDTPEAPPTWGPEYEEFATKQIAQNRFGNQLPPMEILISGQVESGQGLDRIGFAMEGGKLTIYHFEMKWNNPNLPGQPPAKAQLSMTKTRGLQTGQAWTEFALTKFCDGSHPSAVAGRDALLKLIPHKLGLPPGTTWSPAQLKNYLLSNIKTSKRVVVVPPHVNIKRLWMQMIALTRHDQRQPIIIKTQH